MQGSGVQVGATASQRPNVQFTVAHELPALSTRHAAPAATAWPVQAGSTAAPAGRARSLALHDLRTHVGVVVAGVSTGIEEVWWVRVWVWVYVGEESGWAWV